MLAPLTKLRYIKRNFKWTEVKQDGFKEIKRIMAQATLLNYPYFNEKLKLVPMLVRSNQDQLSSRKLNLSLSTVETYWFPNNGIQ